MTNLKARQNRITLIMMSLTIFGMIARVTSGNLTGITKIIFGISITGLWCGLITAWCILVRHRVIQTGIRRYITAMCIFMILWFLFRGLKYYIFPPQSTASRYCWYAYYIPMMLYPTCALCAMTYTARSEEWKLPRHAYLIFLIPVIICGFVLTNDFHQLVFIFPKDASVWSDVSYRYGPLYALYFSWFLICTVIMLLIISKRCRLPQKNSFYAKLPLLPPFLGLIYSLAYITGYDSIFRDVIIMMCFFSVWTFELAIRQGYIRSNYNYQEIFQRSSIAAQIFDENLYLRYNSGNFQPYENEILHNAIRQGEYRQGNTNYVSEIIDGGYVVWKEDVSELVHLQSELESANAYLEDQNMVRRKSNESKLRRRKLEEQNHLYNEMQNQTQDKLIDMDRLITDFAIANGTEEGKDLLLIGVLTSYLKRRNNLIFLAEDSQKIPGSELKNCMRETAKILEVFGITCLIQMDIRLVMNFGVVVALYDAFEIVVEDTASQHPVYFVTLTKEKEDYVLRMRVSGIERLSERISSIFMVIEEEEADYLLETKVMEDISIYEDKKA